MLVVVPGKFAAEPPAVSVQAAVEALASRPQLTLTNALLFSSLARRVRTARKSILGRIAVNHIENHGLGPFDQGETSAGAALGRVNAGSTSNRVCGSSRVL